MPPPKKNLFHTNSSARTFHQEEIQKWLKIWRRLPTGERGRKAEARLKELGVTVRVAGDQSDSRIFPFVLSYGIRQMPRRARLSNPNLEVFRGTAEWLTGL